MNQTIKATSKLDCLKPFFLELSADTLEIYSDPDPENKSYAFRGTLLDTVNITAVFGLSQNEYHWNQQVFGCYRFSLNDSLIALVARAPGLYVSSAIYLFLFDLKSDQIIGRFLLADRFGDAGEEMNLGSYMVKSKNQTELLSYKNSSYDHHVQGGLKDTLVERWNAFSSRSLCKMKFDTLSTDSQKLWQGNPILFEAMFRKLSLK
jgi:hypothetical protein